MDNNARTLERMPSENIKFNHLIQALIWAKMKTGKPSTEIVSAVLRINKE